MQHFHRQYHLYRVYHYLTTNQTKNSIRWKIHHKLHKFYQSYHLVVSMVWNHTKQEWKNLLLQTILVFCSYCSLGWMTIPSNLPQFRRHLKKIHYVCFGFIIILNIQYSVGGGGIWSEWRRINVLHVLLSLLHFFRFFNYLMYEEGKVKGLPKKIRREGEN